MVILLGGCDMVLGKQWLEILGPITCDFEKLVMQFPIGHKKVLLQGIRQGSVRDMMAIKLNKLREAQLSMIVVPEVPAKEQMLVCSLEAKHQSDQESSKEEQRFQQESSGGGNKLLPKLLDEFYMTMIIDDQQPVVPESLSPVFDDFSLEVAEFCKYYRWKQRLSPKSWMFKYRSAKENIWCREKQSWFNTWRKNVRGKNIDNVGVENCLQQHELNCDGRFQIK
ncbi:PREDICTED: uncharacterized protein LOC109128813, partial [Camelina sativa]|uniref:Uncharacterized protein LOC109128813 n=1 Tax=Camelina sativa TaxID=90675 RepID=A0ABM1QXC2_CAMSA